MENKFKITAIEGVDHIGKSTLARAYATLTNSEYVYEPYGETPVTKQLRQFALHEEYNEEVSGVPREYLMATNRAVSNKRNIKLLESTNILTDRSMVSGRVYATMENIDMTTWESIQQVNMKTLLPSTIVYVTNKERRIPESKQNNNDIYDSKPQEFFDKLHVQFVDALRWFKTEWGCTIVNFENSFDHTPEENAQKLKDILC